MAPTAPTDLLLASQNPGKLAEMRQLVEGMPFRIVGPRDVGIAGSPDETGTTFIENAILKARHYSKESGLLAVADDSGISVEALGGGPGLHSSRFGGEGATDEDRNRLLLERLRGVPTEKRGARFTSAVAVARGGEILFQAVETVEGRIAEETRGSNGFGYDPLFFYPPYGRTFGEVPREMKDRVSHRGKAFARLREFLATLA
jgi:XTP/dITP diphosphohydrolase